MRQARCCASQRSAPRWTCRARRSRRQSPGLRPTASSTCIPRPGPTSPGSRWRKSGRGAFIREALELAAIEHVAPRVTDDQLGLLRRNLRIQRVMLDDGRPDRLLRARRTDARADALIHRLPPPWPDLRERPGSAGPGAPASAACTGTPTGNLSRARSHRRAPSRPAMPSAPSRRCATTWASSSPC